MMQKVIKIGSSLGITIPSKEVAEMKLMPGDSVEVSITKKQPQNADFNELSKSLDDFMKLYGSDLKNLADR